MIGLGCCCLAQRRNYERRIDECRVKPTVDPDLLTAIPAKDDFDPHQELEKLRKQNKKLKAQLAGAKSSKESIKSPPESLKAPESSGTQNGGSNERLTTAVDAKIALLGKLLKEREQKIDNIDAENKTLKRELSDEIEAHKRTIENPICTNKWCRDCVWRRSCEKTIEMSDRKRDSLSQAATAAAAAAMATAASSSAEHTTPSAEHTTPSAEHTTPVANRTVDAPVTFTTSSGREITTFEQVKVDAPPPLPPPSTKAASTKKIPSSRKSILCSSCASSFAYACQHYFFLLGIGRSKTKTESQTTTTDAQQPPSLQYALPSEMATAKSRSQRALAKIKSQSAEDDKKRAPDIV